MTRVERAREREQRQKDQLDAARRQRTQLEAQERAAIRAALHRRHTRIGAMADAAGLLQWDDSTLTAIFVVLSGLLQAPDPVKVLEGLLADAGVLFDGSHLTGWRP